MNQTVVQFQASRSAVPAGTRLNDIYEIEEQIAAGGMGEIYRGRLIETGDLVAIKMIKPELADNEAVLALFRKEASALHHLHHDSIVRYYVFTVDRTLKRPYLAMEFVEGRQLQDVLRQRPLTFDEVNILRKRLASGLQAAHEKGIIHRDMSPDNIILPNEDVRQAKIIDFGIARSTKMGHATVIGDGFAGKYNYVSPEQLGMYGGDVTGQSDIYSLALVLAECLLGKALDMSGSQAEVVLKRQNVPDLSAIDVRIRPLLDQMLQPKPADRPVDMTAVAEWLPQATTRGKKGTVYKAGAEAEAESKSKMPLIAGAAAALALAGGGGWFMMQPSPAPPVTATAPSPILAPTVASAPSPSPPSPAPPDAPAQRRPLDVAERTARVVDYVRYYDGGQCFAAHAHQVSDRSAQVDVLASSDNAVQLFASDFRNVNGFDAKITTIAVTPQQCDLVAFLQRVDPSPHTPVSVQLAQGAVKRGARLQASFVGAGNRALEVLAIQDDGAIKRLTGQTSRDQAGVKFDGSVGDANQTPGRQTLLIGIASTKPLQSIARSTQNGAAFLTDLAVEIERAGEPVSVTVAAVKHE